MKQAGTNGLLVKSACNITNFNAHGADKTCFGMALVSCSAGFLSENMTLNICCLVLPGFIPPGLQSQKLGWMVISQNSVLQSSTTLQLKVLKMF